MKLSLSIAICFFSICSFSQLAKNDSLNILTKINDWNTSWDTKDPKLAAKWYTEEARFVNAFGDTRNGSKEIEQLLTIVFSLPFVMSGKSETMKLEFQIVADNIVIVHTIVERAGQKMPDQSVIPKRNTTHMRIFKKFGADWRIISHLISDARNKESANH